MTQRTFHIYVYPAREATTGNASGYADYHVATVTNMRASCPPSLRARLSLPEKREKITPFLQ